MEGEKDAKKDVNPRYRGLKPLKKGHAPLIGQGRPKGQRNLKTLLKIYLQQPFAGEKFDPEHAIAMKLSNAEAFALATVLRSIRQGGHDSNIILDRIMGAVEQTTKIKSEPVDLSSLGEKDRLALAEIGKKIVNRK